MPESETFPGEVVEVKKGLTVGCTWDAERGGLEVQG